MPRADDETQGAQQDFVLERGEIMELREVSGRVLDLTGHPINAARISIEDRGGQAASDQYGEFKLSVPDGTVVLEVTGEGFDTLRFDASSANAFVVKVPRPSQLGSVQREGQRADVNLVFPRAASFSAFDAHVAEQQVGTAGGQEVVMQFSVSRKGRPKNITSGPGEQDRALVRRARELLQSGPDWPEAYRRAGWRYTLKL